MSRKKWNKKDIVFTGHMRFPLRSARRLPTMRRQCLQQRRRRRKLDGVDYSEKLSAILKQNEISSVTVVRMEVPCCGGLENAVLGQKEKHGKKSIVDIADGLIVGRLRK